MAQLHSRPSDYLCDWKEVAQEAVRSAQQTDAPRVHCPAHPPCSSSSLHPLHWLLDLPIWFRLHLHAVYTNQADPRPAVGPAVGTRRVVPTDFLAHGPEQFPAPNPSPLRTLRSPSWCHSLIDSFNTLGITQTEPRDTRGWAAVSNCFGAAGWGTWRTCGGAAAACESIRKARN